MREIRLYGHLGQRFGKRHRLDVETPAEAVRALCSQHPAMHGYLIEHSEPGYRVLVGDETRTEDTLAFPCGMRETIRIVPVVAGAGSGKGVFGIVLGVALVAATMVGGGGPLATFLIDTVGTGAYTGAVMSATGALGWGLILSGVSSLLFAPPKAPSQSEREPVESKPSYIFNGPVNVTTAGGPVPLLYGRMRVGSVVVSAGLKAEQIA